MEVILTPKQQWQGQCQCWPNCKTIMLDVRTKQLVLFCLLSWKRCRWNVAKSRSSSYIFCLFIFNFLYSVLSTSHNIILCCKFSALITAIVHHKPKIFLKPLRNDKTGLYMLYIVDGFLFMQYAQYIVCKILLFLNCHFIVLCIN